MALLRAVLTRCNDRQRAYQLAAPTFRLPLEIRDSLLLRYLRRLPGDIGGGSAACRRRMLRLAGDIPSDVFGPDFLFLSSERHGFLWRWPGPSPHENSFHPLCTGRQRRSRARGADSADHLHLYPQCRGVLCERDMQAPNRLNVRIQRPTRLSGRDRLAAVGKEEKRWQTKGPGAIPAFSFAQYLDMLLFMEVGYE